MEIGESAKVAVAKSAKKTTWSFRAEIVELSFKSKIKVLRARTLVSAPHWKKGADPKDVWTEAKAMELPEDAGYSKAPAALLVRHAPGTTQDVIKLKINISESKNVSGQAQIIGRLGSLEFTGQCPVSAGEHSVDIKIKELPEETQWVRGGIAWGIQVPDPDVSIVLGTTQVEMFFLLDTPPAPFAQGVWAEALRFLGAKAGVMNQKTAALVASKVASYCHTPHDLTYDTKEGAPRYGNLLRGGWSLGFRLTDYMKRADPECCCYDQASAVQTFCAAMGVSAEWNYMEPFGFIKEVNLVGVGLCNNPFFRSNGTDKLISRRDPRRTGFGNHAFCKLEGKVLDACAGPEVGTRDLEGYLKKCIDYDPALNAIHGRRPGLPHDAKPRPPVPVLT
ncbi:MAG TPA: hypothetical protein VK447_18185 [Myxococcaceae bacterium]|nr:hypothetical protein [Myxococcaceae bacterium]